MARMCQLACGSLLSFLCRLVLAPFEQQTMWLLWNETCSKMALEISHVEGEAAQHLHDSTRHHSHAKEVRLIATSLGVSL